MRFCAWALLYLAAGQNNSDDGSDQTDMTVMLNKQIATGNGLYKGGKGILVRTPDDFDNSPDPPHVLPATFWTNDIHPPTALYPSGNPWCPHGSSDGYEQLSWSKCPHQNGPWTFATVSAVIGVDGMQKIMPEFDKIQDTAWGWGVFYPTDANAADKRCHYDGNGWNCPGWYLPSQGSKRQDPSKKGAGYFDQGNPDAKLPGGGAGCHFDTGLNSIDQVDAGKDTDNLVQDAHCQCNYKYNKDWNGWVTQWIGHNTQKTGFEWRSWLGSNRGKKAPSWALDTTMCWMNNPRDMIALQNAIYARRTEWNNQMTPVVHGGGDANDRMYWGWNEIPVQGKLVNDANNWDAWMIKLPANLCGGRGDFIRCLGGAEKQQLEDDLQTLVTKRKIMPGKDFITKRPGSYMVAVREFKSGAGYQRQFFCENWSSPNNRFKLMFFPQKGTDSGACYLDTGSVMSV